MWTMIKLNKFSQQRKVIKYVQFSDTENTVSYTRIYTLNILSLIFFCIPIYIMGIQY